MSDRLYFRQFLAGRDFAVDDDLARSMRNFTYAVGDRDAGEVLLVDPAYRPGELVDLVGEDGLVVTGAVATHYHPDHIGGELMAARHVDGVAKLREIVDVPLHVHVDEVNWVVARSGVTLEELVAHEDGDVLTVGSVDVTLMHTPGHTPGSLCLVVGERLMSGDTLFIDGCGRTDLPGGNAEEMYRTLHERLRGVSDDVVLFPGHLYSPESHLAMGLVRERNFVLAPRTLEGWLAMFPS